MQESTLIEIIIALIIAIIVELGWIGSKTGGSDKQR
jgi:hypothetical protein